jgi:hypothetical protein
VENIKRLACSVVIILALIGAGCSSSDNSMQNDSAGTQETRAVPEKNRKSAPGPSVRKKENVAVPVQQRFNVQADTLTVQTRKKEKSTPAPVTVKSALPQHYYSIQIGAYRLKSNADRTIDIIKKRFPYPVIRFYEPGIKMERICIGHFTSFKAAVALLQSIQRQYPKDYKDAWIAELKK